MGHHLKKLAAFLRDDRPGYSEDNLDPAGRRAAWNLGSPIVVDKAVLAVDNLDNARVAGSFPDTVVVAVVAGVVAVVGRPVVAEVVPAVHLVVVVLLEARGTALLQFAAEQLAPASH